MSDLQPDANHIVQAITQRLQHELPPPETPQKPDAARHRITVISRFAARVDRIVKDHESLSPSRPLVDQLLVAGRESSSAVPFRCTQCFALFHHQPPSTTAKLCATCNPEQRAQEQRAQEQQQPQ